jgi:hypothetical protein
MRGGSAPSWQEGQGLCPAEKAETAARCGFTVPVLEGARRVVDPEMHALSSLVVPSARGAARSFSPAIAALAAAQALLIDPGGSIPRSGANKSDRTRPHTSGRKCFSDTSTSTAKRTGQIEPERHPRQRKPQGLALPGQ